MSSELLAKFKNQFQVDGVDVIEKIDKLNKSAFDDLPIGAILLDDKANIIKYNRSKGELTNRDPNQVLGMNFFLSLAVCGVTEHFHGRFKVAFKAMSYDQIFPFVFFHEMLKTPMMVRMTKSRVVNGVPHVCIFGQENDALSTAGVI